MLVPCLSSPSARALVLALIASASLAAAQTSAQQTPAKPQTAQAAAGYNQLPLSFESNQGQAKPGVDFLSRGTGYSVFLTRAGAVLALGKPAACNAPENRNNFRKEAAIGKPAPCAASTVVKQDVVYMTLAGASNGGRTSRPSGEDQLPGKVNYFLGNDPSHWRTNLPTYSKVHYSGVYSGVDLVYYGNRRQLEYDFIVQPGADPTPIALQFSGTKSLKIAENGDLILQGQHGEAALRKPVVYQDKNGLRHSVSGEFRKISNHTVGFSLGAYDRTRPLIIDPILVYSTYLGGSGANGNGDQGNGIAVDSAGNAYVVGTTYSTDFPVTPDAFQSQNASSAATPASTVFVSELNAAGTALVYSTYLGGSSGDAGFGIALDAANNAYVTGTTYSTDFPITCGALQQSNKTLTTGASTAFVTKINSLGDHLAYSTYLGGQGSSNYSPRAPQGDVAQAIAVSASGLAYVTGYTWSSNFPVTKGALQTVYQGIQLSSGVTDSPNAFVSELNGSGSQLVYSTFLGGTGTASSFGAVSAGDYGNAIALDQAGDAFVAGTTSSANFPVTASAIQPTLKASPNGFVTELNPTGTKEVYSTYLGGTGGDAALAVVIDSAGLAYVAGKTSSSDFPVTEGVVEGANLTYLQNFVAYGPVGFVTKFNLNGSALMYSTYVEGHDTAVTGLAVDSSGNAYLTGSAGTAGAGLFAAFQGTPDAFPVPASTGNSAFLVKLNPTASVLNYATLLGGGNNDAATSLALDGAGNAYITGSALSTNFPTSTEAYQSTNNAAADQASNAFIGKFALAGENNQTSYEIGFSSVPIPTSLTLNSADWVSGDDWELTVGVTLNSGGPGPPPTGTVNLSVNGILGCCYVPGDVTGSSTWTGVSGEIGASNYPGGPGPGSPWQATYSGDAIYGSSSVTQAACTLEICYPAVDSLPALHATLKMKAASPGKFSGALESAVLNPLKGVGPPAKFTLPAASQQTTEIRSAVQSETQAACIAPLPALTVTVHSVSRLYGAANPTFTDTVSGLMGTDTVTVSLQTAATPSSPVGSYPITATVSGPDASKYAISIDNATVNITKAPLYIEADNVSSNYGQTPPQPTGYYIVGFVNGDNMSAVSGAPALTTSVNSTTPVGAYKIGVQIGTLTSANYYFNLFGNGEGSVIVQKASLTIIPTNLTMIEGQPVPTLTYTLSGFVNGETALTATSGMPVLSTSATSATKPGNLPILVTSYGTLTAPNYRLLWVQGAIKILP